MKILGNPLLANARALAIDNRNQLWIGTMGGFASPSKCRSFYG